MGSLIRTYTFDRNALKRNALASGDAVHNHIELVKKNSTIDKTASNIIGALAHYMGIFKKSDSGFETTKVAEAFELLYAKNKQDAFQWLLTRALWRFVVPNGTACSVNETARSIKATFSLFPCILSLLVHLQALSKKERYLYHEEFCRIYDDDANWMKSPSEVLTILLRNRAASGLPKNPKRLLDDLEPAYTVPRDNLNGYLNKALLQTGIFEEYSIGGSPVGIAISGTLDQVLQRRIRYIIDNPVGSDLESESWEKFLDLHPNDLPQEAVVLSSPPLPLADMSDDTLSGLTKSAITDFQKIGLRLQGGVVKRFVASLLAKQFLILTGLSGSGKTKLASAFAIWISREHSTQRDPFKIGSEITSERISYYVHAADSTSIILLNKSDVSTATKACLPRELISEWVDVIIEKGFNRDTPARTIREVVAESTQYSTQLNSFETHLKAAAFAVIERDQEPEIKGNYYSLIPVGADWTNRDPLFGYTDALSQGKYCMPSSGALQLILAAQSDPSHPYFLILDEMNLSHVERYFADILSAMESGEFIKIHEARDYYDGEGTRVPDQIKIPPNLFVIGTVNVDETTYMFSPKVLDRANVIEFAVSDKDMSDFLDKSAGVDVSLLAGRGAGYAEALIVQTTRRDVSIDSFELKQKEIVFAILNALFKVLSVEGAEFGYRTAHEISRFLCFHSNIYGKEWKLEDGLDAAIMQKILTKLHGSKSKLGPVLTKIKDIVTKERFPISFAKIERMELRLKQNGFTSYAEA